MSDDPDAVPSVTGADGTSRDTVPDSIIPDLGKVSENSVHPETKQAWDVLQEDEAGSYLASQSFDLRPETRPCTFEASALASETDVLARETSGEDIAGNSVSSKSVGCEGGNVVIDFHSRPVVSQDSLAERFLFAERDGLHAGGLEANVEAADPGKQ